MIEVSGEEQRFCPLVAFVATGGYRPWCTLNETRGNEIFNSRFRCCWADRESDVVHLNIAPHAIAISASEDARSAEVQNVDDDDGD